jgi:hypothetical protein
VQLPVFRPLVFRSPIPKFRFPSFVFQVLLPASQVLLFGSLHAPTPAIRPAAALVAREWRQGTGVLCCVQGGGELVAGSGRKTRRKTQGAGSKQRAAGNKTRGAGNKTRGAGSKPRERGAKLEKLGAKLGKRN